jgi:hypothetical protein
VGVHGIFISAIRKSAFVMLSVIADVKNLFSFYIYLMLFLCISIACFILCFHLLYTDLFSVSSLVLGSRILGWLEKKMDRL